MKSNELTLTNVTLTGTTFKNERLNGITADIVKLTSEAFAKVEKTQIMIADLLAEVAHNELWKDDGFESTLDYAMQTFGWKKAYAYASIQLGVKRNTNQLPDGNFNAGQLREMFPLSREKLDELVEAGEITEDMSAKQIREAIKPYKKERKTSVKAEKVYYWYLDGVPGRGDIEATESQMLSSAENSVKAVAMSYGEKVNGVLIASDAQIRFYAKGEEVPEAIDTTAEGVEG